MGRSSVRSLGAGRRAKGRRGSGSGARSVSAARAHASLCHRGTKSTESVAERLEDGLAREMQGHAVEAAHHAPNPSARRGMEETKAQPLFSPGFGHPDLEAPRQQGCETIAHPVGARAVGARRGRPETVDAHVPHGVGWRFAGSLGNGHLGGAKHAEGAADLDQRPATSKPAASGRLDSLRHAGRRVARGRLRARGKSCQRAHPCPSPLGASWPPSGGSAWGSRWTLGRRPKTPYGASGGPETSAGGAARPTGVRCGQAFHRGTSLLITGDAPCRSLSERVEHKRAAFKLIDALDACANACAIAWSIVVSWLSGSPR